VERVAFLVEETNTRLRCMLNPETIVFKRLSGVRVRESADGVLAGAYSGGNMLLFTGGGQTTLDLDLVFDVTLAEGSTIASGDVRELTAPIWALSENSQRGSTAGRRPPIARFVWGKNWNIRGVVHAIAERLENFDASGMPRRSWLRLRMLQVPEDSAPARRVTAPPLRLHAAGGREQPSVAEGSDDKTIIHRTVATGAESGSPQVERLDQIAQRYYGNPDLWRLLAVANDIEDPTTLPAGLALEIPPLPGA